MKNLYKYIIVSFSISIVIIAVFTVSFSYSIPPKTSIPNPPPPKPPPSEPKSPSPPVVPPVNITWSQSTKIVEMHNISNPFVLSTSSNETYLFFSSDRDGTYDIYLMIKKNGLWNNPQKITNDSFQDYTPSAIQKSDGKIHLFFSRGNNIIFWNGKIDIFWMTYNGINWTKPIRITDEDHEYDVGGIYPTAFEGLDGKVYLVYELLTGMTENINFLRYQIFDGFNYSKSIEVAISNNSCIGSKPTAFQDIDGKIYLYSSRMSMMSPYESVDEYVFDGKNWTMNKIDNITYDHYTKPIAFIYNNKSFLFYDNYNWTESPILMQIKNRTSNWSLPYTVVENGTTPSISIQSNGTICLIYSNIDVKEYGNIIDISGDILYEKIGVID